MADTETLEQPQPATAPTLEVDEFSSLLTKEFRPRSDRAREEVDRAVRTLAEQALAETVVVSSDTIKTIESIIAAIDRKLSEQVNLVMHQPEFQQLESAWRGLHYLVNNTETDEMLKIRVMNISKRELGRTLRRFKGTAWDQSPIFKRMYEEEYGQFGGEPYGCLVSDYYFDHSPPDVELLGEISKVCAAAHVPFIAGAAPTVMQMDSWQELSKPARSDQDLPDGRLRLVARVARLPKTRVTSAWPCRAFWRGCPMAPRPTRSTSSLLKRTPRQRIRADTCGRTRPMRWPTTLRARSNCTGGARASAGSSRAAPSKDCQRTPFRPMTAAST